MAKRKTVAVLVAGAGVAGLLLWRRRARRREHVDLYLADGSMVSFERGSPEASSLIPVARAMLDAGGGEPGR